MDIRKTLPLFNVFPNNNYYHGASDFHKHPDLKGIKRYYQIRSTLTSSILVADIRRIVKRRSPISKLSP